jgi:hypothetical protein
VHEVGSVEPEDEDDELLLDELELLPAPLASHTPARQVNRPLQVAPLKQPHPRFPKTHAAPLDELDDDELEEELLLDDDALPVGHWQAS